MSEVIIHQQLTDAHLGKGELDRQSFRPYFPTIAQVPRGLCITSFGSQRPNLCALDLLAVIEVLKRVYDMKQDGNAGAYYKLAGELFVLGEDCEVGMCQEAAVT